MSERPLSILHVIASLAPRYGGPAKVAELCESLAERGNRVEIAATTIDGPFDLDVPIGVPIEQRGCAVTHFQVRRPRTPATAPGLVPWLRKRVCDFDVLHVHGLYLFPTLASTFVARRSQVPYVHQPHGALTTYHRAHHPARKALYETLFERRNLRCAAAVRYDSEQERDDALARGFPEGVVIPPGTPTPPPRPREARVPGRIAFLGRLSAKKGVDVLLEALPLVVLAAPAAHLLVAGPDDEGIGEQLRERARALGVSDRLTLLGLVTGQEKVDLLCTASVVAAPSIAESFGATVTEAMAVETPVVVTRGIPIHEQVDRRSAGLVVDRTPRAMAAGIQRILGDEALAARLGENGRLLVESEYSWAEVARRVEELYRDALNRRLPLPARHTRIESLPGQGMT